MAQSLSLEIPQTIEGYRDELVPWLDSLKGRSLSEWADAMRWYARNDLFFLGRHVLMIGSVIHSTEHVPVFDHQMYVDMARQYERHIAYGEGLDCSARRQGKSEWRACALPIWMMIKYPEISINIYSVEKFLALKHFKRIQKELTDNKLLLYLESDIFYTNPVEEAKSNGLTWSKSEGLIIKGRTMNRSTPTIEVSAYYGGGPIGSGYELIIADDIERSAEVATPEGIEKLDKAFGEATTLLTPVVTPQTHLIVSNTKFAPNGLIQRIYDRLKAKNPDMVRSVPAEIIEDGQDDRYVWGDEDYVGPLGGRISWPYVREELIKQWEKKIQKSEYMLQYGLSFRAPENTALKKDLINWYKEPASEKGPDCLAYILVDPSRGINDPSAMLVVGLTADKRRILLDAVVKKLDPDKQEFYDAIFLLAMKWRNFSQGVVQIRVEDVGPSNWAKMIRDEIQKRGCYVPVASCRIGQGESAHARSLGDRKFKTGKADRVWRSWSPALNSGKVWMPSPQRDGGHGILCDIDGKGSQKDVIEYFIDVEYLNFPVSKHDDILDAWSLLDHEKTNQDTPLQYGTNQRADDLEAQEGYWAGGSGGSWMSAVGG